MQEALTSYEKIDTGQLRICIKCGQYKEEEEFFDKSLKSGVGRICNACKRGKRKYISHNIKKVNFEEKAIQGILCPSCHSRMVLRDGKYGNFYGCSRFPICRGTRRYR